MERVAIYIRLSREDIKKIDKGDDSESVKNQRLVLTEYAVKKGWQIYDFYVDEDYSGADRERPAFERLLEDAENQEFSIVLCKTQSRFVRDLETVEKIIHGTFLRWGIRFISLLDGADTANIANKKSRQIHGMVDEWYLEDLSRNIRETFKAKMRDGQFLGPIAPFGYIKDGHKLVVDVEAAKTVRKIFSLYLQGYGTHRIAQILTEAGIDKPSYHFKKTNKNFRLPNVTGPEGLWPHTTVRRILRNQTYIGTLVQGKETTVSYKDRKRVYKDEKDWIKVENNHEPIISEKDFYEVQTLLNKKRRNIKKKGETHIFATKVKCLYCGGSMIRSTTRSRKYDDLTYTYLKCKNYARGGAKFCKYINRISYPDLYFYVEKELKKIIALYEKNPDATEITSNQIKRVDYLAEIKKLTGTLRTIETEIVEKGRVLTELYVDKAKGLVSADDYIIVSQSLQQERKQLELRKNSINEKIKEISVLESKKADIKKVIKTYLKVQKLTHEIVVETIDYIEIGVGDGQDKTINIYWKL